MRKLANRSLAFSLFANTLVPPAEFCSGSAMEASDTIRRDVVVVVVVVDIGERECGNESGTSSGFGDFR